MGVDLQTYRCRIGTFGRSVIQQLVCEVKHEGDGDYVKLLGAVSFIGCLLLIAGIERNPGPGSYPERKASEQDIAIIAQYIVLNWELLGSSLGVKQTEIERICLDNGTTVKRVYALLRSWRQNGKDEATLDKLFHALERLELISVDWPKLSEQFNFKDPSRTPAHRAMSFEARTVINRYTDEEVKKRGSEKRSDFLKLVNTFGLEEHYPGKITLPIALSNSLRFMEEEHETGKICIKDVPWYLLNGILTLNCETRDRVLKICKELCKDDDSDSDSEDIADEYSALDILVSVFQCSDMRLKGILTKKLFDCQIAIPFMVSNFTDTSSYVLNVWPLRFTGERNNSNYSEQYLLDSKTLVISFARFGRPDMSKSCVLNNLISSNNTSPFFNKDSYSGMSRKCIGSGYAELFSCSKGDSYITYINIRGDILLDCSEECILFFSSLSDIIVLNVDEHDIHIYQTKIVEIVSRFPNVIIISNEKKTNYYQTFFKHMWT